MNLYQPLSSFLTHFPTKLLNRFLGILLVGFALNMGTIMSVQADAVGDEPSDALKIELNQEYSDDISSFLGTFFNDKDFYKFELPSDGYIIISLRTEDISTSLPNDGWAGKLYQSKENGALGSALLNISLFRDDKIAFHGEGLSAGTYYIEISCTFFESLACNPEPYYLKVGFEESNFYEKEPNDDLTTATPIQLNQEYTGNLSSYEDRDYYIFQLLQDSNITFTLEHNDASLTSEEIYWKGLLLNSNSEVLHTIYLQGTPDITSVQEKLPAGIYYLKIDTDQTPSYIIDKPKPGAQYHLTVTSTKVIYAGYAILVQGRDKDETLKEAYKKTLDRVYQRLIKRGFLSDHIRRFEQDKVNPYDDIPDEYAKPAIKNAIENWAKEKLNSLPAPFYLIMIDHGNEEYFGLHPESITADDLSGWLDTLESGLIDEAKKEPRFFILGTCHSGSFIDKVSKPGRVIITSAKASELSYTGLKEPDGIPEGELFIKVLFEQLEKSKTFKAAFETATQEIETHPFAYGKQHPLLDDNGDSHGSPRLNVVRGDGKLVRRLKLGIDTSFVPIDIDSTTETLYLKNTESSAILWLTTNNNEPNQVEGSILIQSPNLDITPTQQVDNAQIEIDLPTKDLVFNDKTSRFETTYDAFNEPGKYTIFYHASDLSGNISPTYRSVVYKNKDGNHPPEPFSLLSPENDATTQTVLILDWEKTTDSDGDPVIYNLIIGADKELQTIVYQEEGLKYSSAIIDSQAQVINETGEKGLKTQVTYYWRVEAVDSFGERTLSEISSFVTNDTSLPIGTYTADVVGVLDESMDDVTLTIIPINNPELTTTAHGENGHFNFKLFEESHVKINAAGFQEIIIENESLGETEKGTIDLGTIKLQPLVATFSFNEQLLNIPVVFVPGTGRFSAKLRGETEGEQMMFILDEIEKVDYVIPNEATFTSETGIVSIPLVEVDMSGTTTRFQVELLLDSQSGKFRLNNAKPFDENQV